MIALFLSACATAPGSGTSPSVDAPAIAVQAGQKVYVELEMSNGEITGIKQVSEIRHPDITMTFNFTKADFGMMLSVKNPASVAVKYHIDMLDYDGKLHKTSSCPVPAGLSVFESWPHPIPEIRVKDFRALPSGATVGCVY